MMKSASESQLRSQKFSKSQNLDKHSSIFNKASTIAALSALNSGGFSQNISVNTLRNAHAHWSFPKAERFERIRPNNTASMVNLPSTLHSKSSSFGFGDKQGLKCIVGRDSPPPTTYRLKSNFDLKQHGFSFGIPYSAYAKVHIEGLNT